MHAGQENSDLLDENTSSDESECEPGLRFIPDTTGLTEEWANGILVKAGVTGATQVQMESRAGLSSALSRVLAVTLHYHTDAVHRSLPLIVKLPPRDPFGRLFVAEAQFDTREIMFYTQLVPAMNNLADEALGPDNGLPVPKCIKAVLPDELGGDSELVLEDITSEGYVTANFAEGLSEERARTALHAVARLHALSLGLREREGPLNQRFDFLFPCERAAAGYLRLVRRGLPQLEQFLRSRPEYAEQAGAISALSARAPSLLSTLLRSTEPAPLVHADFWSGNLLFRERHGRCECIALDWQMVSLGRPMDDVALLILSSLTPELRRSIGDSLIDDYADRLEYECQRLGAGGAAAEIRRGLKNDWPRAALRALLLCAGSVDVAVVEPRAEKRLLEAITDLHAQGVLNLQPDGEDC